MHKANSVEKLKPILIMLPAKLLEDLDRSSRVLRCSRSELIRNSLKRDLEVVQHEVVEAKKVKQRTNNAHKKWMQSEEWDPQERPKKRSIKSFKQWMRDRSSQ